MGTLAAVAVGGACGAVARYGVSLWALAIVPRFPPAGTLIANVTGCLLIGVAMTLAQQGALSEEWRQFVVSGFLGAFTTFSTFGFQTVELVREGRHGAAAFNLAANVVIGIGAVAIGLWVGRRLPEW
jgi:CrcB protein